MLGPGNFIRKSKFRRPVPLAMVRVPLADACYGKKPSKSWNARKRKRPQAGTGSRRVDQGLGLLYYSNPLVRNHQDPMIMTSIPSKGCTLSDLITSQQAPPLTSSTISRHYCTEDAISTHDSRGTHQPSPNHSRPCTRSNKPGLESRLSLCLQWP